MSNGKEGSTLGSIRKYTLLKKIGSGTFATVFLVQDQTNKNLHVMKKMHLSEMSKRNRAYALREVAVLQELNHPNIVSYVESFVLHEKRHDETLCIIMQYADNCDLYELIEKGRKKNLSTTSNGSEYFDIEAALSLLVQICDAMAYCRKMNILHRDIKAKNIFLSGEGLVLLGDFGICKTREPDSCDETIGAQTYVGTPLYLSPEQVIGSKYDIKADMWSLGVVMYEFLTLKSPFYSNNLAELSWKIVNSHPQEIPIPPYTPELQMLVRKLLAKDPNDRPYPKEVLALPWLQPYRKKFSRNSEAMKKSISVKDLRKKFRFSQSTKLLSKSQKVNSSSYRKKVHNHTVSWCKDFGSRIFNILELSSSSKKLENILKANK